jgi:hypothetical protein
MRSTKGPEKHGHLASEATRMKTIPTTIEVDLERRATIRLPADVIPGPYQAVVVLEEQVPTAPRPLPTTADFPRHEIPWPFPQRFTFRREGTYGDDRRGPGFVDTKILVYAAFPSAPFYSSAYEGLDAFVQARD